jgi:CRP-like cAMP-binding protein
MLSKAETEQIRSVFRESPLFTKWRGARARMAELLVAMSFPEGGVVYQPGTPPQWLYLVASGKVTETAAYEGKVWLRQEHGPGQYFGQQDLFTKEHGSRAVAEPGTTIYCMSEHSVRVGLEQNDELAEEMLRKKRTSRMRRIPLFRHLPDQQVRQLAHFIEDHEAAEGSELPLQDKAGIWIVDWGQVRVTGPLASGHTGWEDWGLTAGNFFVANTMQFRAGEECAVTGARARVKTHLFYLPAALAGRLLEAFPETRAFLRNPVDLVTPLRQVPLFDELRDDWHREHIAQFCAWEFVPALQGVTTEGSTGHSLVILLKGAVKVFRSDEPGEERSIERKKAPAWYGKTSLLQGDLRDVTVRAAVLPPEPGQPGVAGAELLVLDRRDLKFAFAEQPTHWPRSTSGKPGIPLVDQMVYEKEETRRFDWLEEGEVPRWHARPHLLWLISPEAIVLLAAILGFLLLRIVPAGAKEWLFTAYLVFGLPFLLLVGIYILINYLNDYYVITNLRVVRRVQQWPVYESRVQAPMDTIQQATAVQNFWGHIFNYGDVSISTAAKAGPILFAHTPDPEVAKDLVLQGKAEAGLANRGQRKELLRRGLRAELDLVVPVPERMRALGDGANPPARKSLLPWKRCARPAKTQRLPGQPRPRPKWLKDLAERLPERLGDALRGGTEAPKPLSNQVVWRKHWINLLWRVIWPSLFLVGIALAAWLSGQLPRQGFLGVTRGDLSFVLFFMLMFALGWWLYRFEDWRNDLYVLSDDKIVDIEAKPLGISTKSRETGLDKVQTVDYAQRGLVAYILDYGNVIIRTAAADEGLDFPWVPHPRLVQATIFQRLDALQRKRKEKERKERQVDMVEALQVYHNLPESHPRP